MKPADCYDTTYTTRNWGRADRIRPAITVKRAREIFAVAEMKMNTAKRATVNKGLTVGQAFEILSKVVTPEMSDEAVLHSLVSRNIVREFGRFLDSPREKRIKSLMQDGGYNRGEATALADDGGFAKF
jgi:hypothetical protein